MNELDSFICCVRKKERTDLGMIFVFFVEFSKRIRMCEPGLGVNVAGKSYKGVPTLKPESPAKTGLWLQIKIGLIHQTTLTFATYKRAHDSLRIPHQQQVNSDVKITSQKVSSKKTLCSVSKELVVF